MNLIIIGQRASGKSAAGRGLAEKVNVPFLDTDDEIERIEKRSIDRIFCEKGEEAFRRVESRVARSLGNLTGHVIAAGGGMPLSPENRKILRNAGRVVWLKCRPETLLSRRSSGDRPPLTQLPLEEEIRLIASNRAKVYSETCHASIDADDLTLPQVIEELERVWRALTKE